MSSARPQKALTFTIAKRDTPPDAALKTRLNGLAKVPLNRVGRKIRASGIHKDSHGRVILDKDALGEIRGDHKPGFVYVRPNSDTEDAVSVDLKGLFIGLAAGRTGSVGTIGRFCTFECDYSDPTNKSIQLKRDEPAKLINHSADYILATVRLRSPSGKFDGKTIQVPAKIINLLAPEDAVGRTFIMREPSSRLNLMAGMQGYVTSLPMAQGALPSVMQVSFTVGGDANGVPTWLCDFGPKTNAVTIKIADQIRFRSPVSANDANLGPFAKHVYQLLSDISRNANNIQNFNGEHLAIFRDEAGCKWLARLAEEGVRLVSSKLVDQVLLAPRFDLDDVMREATLVVRGGNNHSAGLYLRNHEITSNPTKPRGEFKGPGSYGYIGSTGEMVVRLTRSRNDAYNQNKVSVYNAYKSWIFRHAQRVSTVQFFQLPVHARTQDQRQGRVLEILETCFFLMFKTYRASVLAWQPSSNLVLGQSADIELFVSSIYDQFRMAQELTSIAEKSFEASGWSAAGRANMGITDGLNLVTPLDTSSNPAKQEKTLWTKTTTYVEGATTDVFRRSHTRFSSTTAGQDGSMAFMIIAQKQDAGESVRFTADREHAERYGPPAGQKLWVQVEIRRGEPHPCPYLPVPNATPLDCVDEIHSIGIHLFWIQGNGRTAGRYVQAGSSAFNTHYTSHRSSVGKVIALRAFLLGETIAQRPDWIPNFGLARVIELKTDFFKQRVTASYTDTSRPISRSISVDPQLAKQAMQKAGFERIGGQFGQFRSVATTDRRTCDRCFLLTTLGSKPSGSCKIHSGQTCAECFTFGLPCSWTPTVTLLGAATGWNREERQAARDVLGESPVLPDPAQNKVNTFRGSMKTQVVRKLLKAVVMPANYTIHEHFEGDYQEIEADAEEQDAS